MRVGAGRGAMCGAARGGFHRDRRGAREMKNRGSRASGRRGARGAAETRRGRPTDCCFASRAGIPHEVFKEETAGLLDLPERFEYGAGNIFLSQNSAPHHAKLEEILEAVCTANDLVYLGKRIVPVAPDNCGKSALRAMPIMWQIFVGRGALQREHPSADAPEAIQEFNRQLFIVRKQVRDALRHHRCPFSCIFDDFLISRDAPRTPFHARSHHAARSGPSSRTTSPSMWRPPPFRRSGASSRSLCAR